MSGLSELSEIYPPSFILPPQQVAQYMITDPLVFDPEFVPSDVVHRHSEIDVLTSALEPVVDGDPGEDVVLSGPSGVGKTCVSRHSVSLLRERVDVSTAYVNCWKHHSSFKVLYHLLESLGSPIDVRRQSTATEELLSRLESVDHRIIAILDEADQLDSPDLLYQLYHTPGVTMILITNDEDELATRLDERMNSRLHGQPRIRFDRYSESALVDILAKRVGAGLEADSISRSHLRTIADAAAGDARIGLNILLASARRAEKTGADRITDEIIEAAEPAAREAVRQKTISQLTHVQRLIFETLEDQSDWMAAGDLHEEYAKRSKDPVGERMVRTHLQKLEHYNLVEMKGENRWRRYRASS